VKSCNDHVAKFNGDGFVILRGELPNEFVSHIRAEIADFISRDRPKMTPTEAYDEEDAPPQVIKALHGMDRYREFFNALRTNEQLLAMVSAIWPGEEIIAGSVSYFAKPARVGSVTPPHQDNGFHHWNPPQVLELTIAIDASTPENGALICQTGSHKLGELPHRPSGLMGFSRVIVDVPDSRQFPEVALCMSPGDVALHHIDTVHWSNANRSNRSRGQLGITYRTAKAMQDQEKKAQYERDLKALHTQRR